MIKAGIDWGSSTFRAFRFDEHATVTDSITRPLGIKQLTEHIGTTGSFEEILLREIGSWLNPDESIILSGMITSVNGWHETPYLECPVNVSAISDNLVARQCRDFHLLFLPGICQRIPYADVMRGEELQLLGACNTHEPQLAVMPGTHSKWASIEHGTINSFRTIPTGELFQLLLNQSLIGQLAATDHWSPDHFIEGVELGHQTTQIVSELFSCRAKVLMKQLPANGVRSYLSGLLIGNEIKEGRTLQQRITVTLIGDNSLCDRYQSAMEYLGLTVRAKIVDASALGFTRLIDHLNQR